jgi:tRNA (cytidine56-2'-O)-methyltransferase
LVARAFGADSIIITTKDQKIEDTIRSICQRFGGDFSIISGVNGKSVIDQWKGTIVHLTMYGETLESGVKKMSKKDDVLIIVGAEKVPPYFYEVADYNISVGNQPHSEVAALAIFLDRFSNKAWETKEFNGNLEIIPLHRGKKVILKKKT